ncbi:GntR family transcriptional regulator [Gryllotalpicola reticulitermitis]|uniref:GntR family transcriptional regulator n=1 Tax=Gryllotalpicola reticulitermitis TaxID=1184153 RepID=A0ABV8Q5P1_9MICO
MTAPSPDEPSGNDDTEARRAPESYRDVAADLRRRIDQGEFPIGSRLPSEVTLAAEYGVSRRRVRDAMAGLARQGYAIPRPRGGWVVQGRHQTQGFDHMQSFAQWAEGGGRVPGGLVTARERRPATAQEARVLAIRLGEPLLRFTRVRTLEGRVVMIERSTWATWVSHVIDEMPDDIVSTTAALADAGIRVTSGNHRIEAVAASKEDAELLGVRRSSPLLQVSRLTTTREGRVVELGVDRYRAEAIAFEVMAGDAIRTLI